MIRCDRVIVERSGQMVIDRLSLTVGLGETLAVIGRSGAGKSTLLEAVATAIPVRGGDIVLAGHSVRRDPDAVRSRIGYAPAHLPAWPAVRADEFLTLFARSAGLAGRSLAEAVERALDLAGLRGRGDVSIDRLPDGQAKLLLIGRALLHAPEVLVVDDPFGNLDSLQRQSIERLIGDMQIGGRTVIAAVDDAHVPDCFTHLAVLSEGRLLHEGPAAFAAYCAGRAWRYRLHCRGQAEAAARVVARLADNLEAFDANTLDCTLACGLDSSRPPIAGIIEALVRAGIAVEAAGLHPHWTVQLLEPMG
jgi:ABC-2 type transport system ATP-binding protein